MTDTLIDRNPGILGGIPVFAGTRVPVRILMEHLEAGDRLDDFLVDYPTVSRRQAVAVLERATTMLVSGGAAAPGPRDDGGACRAPATTHLPCPEVKALGSRVPK